MKRHKYEPAEVVALRVGAFGEYFDAVVRGTTHEMREGVAIVDVRGPLMHHESWCCDSYDAIKRRVACALAEKPKAIILSIDSPGGLVSGCFDTSKEIAAICAASGVPLYAYVDGQCCSAAYALACVAERIVIPEAAEAGSIGCIAEMVSTAKLDAAMGIERRVITSGSRKADGNPGLPITDESEAAVSQKVNRMAAIFIDHVAAHRPMKIAEVAQMQAGIVIGSEAVPGLCDEVMGLDEMLASIASGEFAKAPASQETKKMTTKASADDGEKKNPFASARAALQAVADDEKADEKERASAKKALAAMDEKEPAKAADEAPPSKDEKKDEPSGEKAIAALVTRAVTAGFEARDAFSSAAQAKAQKVKDDAERVELLASRPDFDASTKALAEGASLADLRNFVKTHPKRKVNAAATAGTLATTRAATQVGTQDPNAPMAQDPRAAHLMKLAMGTVKQEAQVVQRNGQLIIGALPEQLGVGESE